ncbi:MFS transporter [Aquincola sp. S2]|uniref:MFS transporter n=1 Tax=Pseudaquabacterium terrae TaxID=2732868 RepID=A0ABX2EFE5_9BURK|nr:MFS transporter [Aquabacterium terrae]NRF67315.1 MFS transporter [Aquabacterium terrae]
MTLPDTAASSRAARIPRTVWVLGAVSLFMDMSSELIHAVLPLYITTVMGLSVLAVGLIEGFAEATASMLKVVSGFVSDRFARRKPLALLGYGLAALTKPMFPLADTAVGVVAARVIDRVGKGIRGAPRDAMVADVTPPHLRDAAYGLRQSLDTVGAFAGPLLAMLFLWLWNGDLRQVLWIASVPAFIALALLAFGVQEPPAAAPVKRTAALQLAAISRLPRAFWWLIALTAVFSLARLSEAFLVLRAQELQFGVVWIPLVMVVMSVVYSMSSYPAGLLAARFGRWTLLGASLLALVAAELALAMWPGAAGLWCGVALWGLHMGLSQGGLSAAVAEFAPADIRATAFGLFHFVTGVFQLASGALGGWLWMHWGSSVAFLAGACWGAVACAALLMRGAAWQRRR